MKIGEKILFEGKAFEFLGEEDNKTKFRLLSDRKPTNLLGKKFYIYIYGEDPIIDFKWNGKELELYEYVEESQKEFDLEGDE